MGLTTKSMAAKPDTSADENAGAFRVNTAFKHSKLKSDKPRHSICDQENMFLIRTPCLLLQCN